MCLEIQLTDQQYPSLQQCTNAFWDGSSQLNPILSVYFSTPKCMHVCRFNWVLRPAYACGLTIGVVLTIQSSLLAKESDLVVGVRAHKAHYHRFFFAALEPVDGTQFNAGIHFFEHLG
jgi:hypothetical protein